MSDEIPKSEGGRPPAGKRPWPGRFVRHLLNSAVVVGVALLSEQFFEVLRASRIADVPKFNVNLTKAIGDFNPQSMSENFSGRLHNEYGWRLLSLSAPFNLTEARARLLKQYPLVERHKKLYFLANAMIVRDPDYEEWQRQLAAYREDSARIDQYRFPEWVPGFVSKILGLPDALMSMVRGIFAGSWFSKVIGCLTLIVVLLLAFPKCRSLPGAIILLPVLITLIAWVLFLPVLLAAKGLNWAVLHLFGSPMSAPQTSVLTGFSSLWPADRITQRLTEHHVTEVSLEFLKKVDGSD